MCLNGFLQVLMALKVTGETEGRKVRKGTEGRQGPREILVPALILVSRPLEIED